MKIKKSKTEWGEKIIFKGKFCQGEIWPDGGSGYLQSVTKGRKFIPNTGYCCEHGTHKMRVEDILNIAKFYNGMLKELEELNKKL